MLGTLVEGWVATHQALGLLLEERRLDLWGAAAHHCLVAVKQDPAVQRPIVVLAVVALTVLPTENIRLETLTVLLQTTRFLASAPLFSINFKSLL